MVWTSQNMIELAPCVADLGWQVSALKEWLDTTQIKPSFVYCIPCYHNPTSVCLERARFELLLALARQHGNVCVCVCVCMCVCVYVCVSVYVCMCVVHMRTSAYAPYTRARTQRPSPCHRFSRVTGLRTADFIIVFDDPYSLLPYSASASAAPSVLVAAMSLVKATPEEGCHRIIILGSFSKILTPGSPYTPKRSHPLYPDLTCFIPHSSLPDLP